MRSSTRLSLTLLIASVAAVKIFLQWSVPGFLQGDDVETMEAAFRAAFGLVYDDWEIRSHLLSGTIVAPALRAASLIPGITTEGLLLAGTMPFVLAGALATILVFRLAVRWGLSEGEALAAAALYAVHAIPVVYGIGGFPRALVTPLVVGAALLAGSRRALALVAAGACVGLAGAARYSEWMFVLPLLAATGVVRASRPPLGGGDLAEPGAGGTPAPHGRGDPGNPEAGGTPAPHRALLVIIGFVAGALLVGAYDAISGEGAFSSLVAFVAYTTSGASSSMQAAQPAWWYVARVHQWLPLTAIPLLFWGWYRWRRNAALWIAVPLVVLSIVHHKELRYLQNVVPFVAIAMAAGVRRQEPAGADGAVARCGAGVPPAPDTRKTKGGRDARTTPRLGVPALVLLALSIVWAAWGVNRLERRSSSAVAAARAIAAEQPSAVAFAQAWAYGNHLYVRPSHVVDLPVAPEPADLERAREAEFVALYASTTTPELRAALTALGFEVWRQVRDGGRTVDVFRKSRARARVGARPSASPSPSPVFAPATVRPPYPSG